MVASITGSGASNRTDSLLPPLATKSTDTVAPAAAQDTPAAAGDAGNGQASGTDGDNGGRVTQSALTKATAKLSDQLNAQFDAGRVARGGQAPAGHAGVHGMGGGGAASAKETDDTDATGGSTYAAAADTDGDGTVSEAEQAAYDKKVASGAAGAGGAVATEAGLDA